MLKNLFIRALSDQKVRILLRYAFLISCVLVGKSIAKNVYHLMSIRTTCWLDGRKYSRDVIANYHVLSAYLFSIYGEITPRPLPSSRPLSGNDLVVALCSPFSGSLSYGTNFIREKPDNIRLIAIDIPYDGKYGRCVSELCDEYYGFDEFIKEADRHPIDVLINVYDKLDFHKAALIKASARIFLSCGSTIPPPGTHDIVMLAQPVPRYIVDEARLLHRPTKVALPGYRIVESTCFYDTRSEALANMPWHARRDLIVYHGSLYKLLEGVGLVLDLLDRHPSFQFEIYGKANDEILSELLQTISRRGLAERVAIREPFSAVRDEAGSFDAGWSRFFERLKSAKLWVSPLYTGGGSARFEAMLAGVPTIVMTYDENWASTPVHYKLPPLSTPQNEVLSEVAYLEKMDMILHDASYAAKIIAAQHGVVERIKNGGHLWQQILECGRSVIGSC